MSVPLLDLTVQNRALEAELNAAFQRVLGSGHFILGQEMQAFESESARVAGSRHALGVSSGTDAILLALMALGVGPGDEVICPSFTFFATAGCVSRVGATPVFADSLEADFNLDPRDVERRLTGRTKAILPVHLFGQVAEMEGILELGRARGVAVVEDAAQAFGAGYGGRLAGSMGVFGAFSFFPSKNLGGFGDSGLLTAQDDALAERARILRVHGAAPKYYHKWIGANFRMDALQAALLRVKLPHLAAYSAARRRNAEFYLGELSRLDGVSFSGVDGVSSGARMLLPSVVAGRDHIWNQFTLRLPREGDRDRLKRWLEGCGVGCEIYYPMPLHEQECFRHLGYGRGDYPVAARLARECLSIPVFPELTGGQRGEVVEALAGFLKGGA